jgi:hypothetical protein
MVPLGAEPWPSSLPTPSPTSISVQWWTTPNAIYNHVLMQNGNIPFTNLIALNVPNGAEFDIDVA